MQIQRSDDILLQIQGFLSASQIRKLAWDLRTEGTLPTKEYSEIIRSLDINGNYIFPAIALINPYLD
jgi:hypothetical protein